jgi:hypothetical protein
MRHGIASTQAGRCVILIALMALLSTGCGRIGDQTAAVKKAIETHLASRSDLAISQMTMDVKDVKVDGDEAGADVVFRVTNSPEMQMGYHYDLRREGGTWKVVDGRPSATDSKHPTGDADPNGMEPNALPPGHPPLESPQGQMPEGHPALPENQ